MTALPQVAVIEDDLATRKALGRILRAGGFEPLSYSSAEEFLASPPERLPACLVLDIGLGGMSGLDLQRRLKALGSTLSVIIMTGLDDAEVRAEAYQLGCVAYLSKESDEELLLGLIRSIVSATRPEHRS
jgi:FixJ family two-component response regulator